MKLIYKRLSYCRGEVGNNIFMFTANSTIRGNGCLVMGRGCARSVRDIYPNIDKKLGQKIRHLSKFGVKFVKIGTQHIGAFQTKYHWQDGSPIELVEYSVRYLKFIADNRPDHIFHLPCPAVSNGGKSVEEILPLLECLPDNVYIYLD